MTTTTTNIPPAVREYFNRRLLVEPYPIRVYDTLAAKAVYPSNAGDRMIWRRMPKLPVLPQTLVEAQAPTPLPVTKIDINAQIQFYGNYIRSSDQVEWTNESNLVRAYNDLLREHMLTLKDTLARDVYNETASSTDAAGGSNGLVPTEPNVLDIKAVTLALRQADARETVPQVDASTRVSTTGLSKSYWAICHVDLEPEISDLDGFQYVHEYSDQTSVMKDSEFGAAHRVRFLTTTNGFSKTVGANTVYGILFVAQNALGTVDYKMAENIMKSRGSAGTGDPLDQVSTFGYKFSNAHRILDDRFCHVLFCTKVP